MDTGLELIVQTGERAVAVPLTGAFRIGSSPLVDLRADELEPLHAVIEAVPGRAAVEVRRCDQAARTWSELLTADGGAVQVGPVLLRLNRTTASAIARRTKRDWSETVIDTQRLMSVQDLDGTARRVFQALFEIGSLTRVGSSPVDLLSRSVEVFLVSARACRVAVYWMSPTAELTTRAFGPIEREPVEPELDPRAMARVLTSTATLSGRVDGRPHAYLPLRAPSGDQSQGAIYLERPQDAEEFSAFDLELVAVLGRSLVLLLERAQAARELRARTVELETAQARLASVLDAISEGILVVRDDGHIELLNQVARSVFDGEPERRSTVLRALPIAAHVAAALRGERTGRHDAVSPLGQTFEVSASPVALGPSAVRDAVVVLRDVTDERERDRAHRESERLRGLGEALATVAHELNNPLTSVVGFASLVADRAPPGLRDQCRRIREQAERCLTIVRDVLTVSRPQRAQTEAVAFDLLDTALKALDAAGADLTSSRVEAAVEGPQLVALADPHRVQQVLVNLLRNAAQAIAEADCPTRRVRVFIGARDDSASVVVEDSGPGVPPELRTRIFRPFATTRAQGTGLGLSVSATLVREWGGTLAVEGVPGCTRFSFDVPLAPAGTAISPPAASDAHVCPRSRCRVYVLDDEESVRELLVEYLRADGHEVVSEGDPRCALERLRDDHAFDVLFLDLHMPGVSGLQVLERLGALGSLLAGRTVLMTGEVDEARVSQARTRVAGALRKPFKLADVREMVASLSPGPGPRGSAGS